ncbi:MAG: hypothetical protein A3F54_02530 [Candidatus Kerfeldbacteria bacterium RIFCSPHIGHO2_12_FULL_48_17]|uniref:Uncharacterized protein n=1 Tax=Candidatus Kerfeldbacteria bacterium RIFCSPHIGHO2_12_FULL_48_17 TaxID=1798542 RepID=A0A1G2AX11_9BACT|nr:MAG: hypothetical protein A3F54_02530 [Candidatus Kerfeldbacteria bacterium RIFCSPHIGHO2_12_FULL_48_17]
MEKVHPEPKLSLHDPDFDAEEESLSTVADPSPTATGSSPSGAAEAPADQSFSWSVLLNHIPVRSAFFLGLAASAVVFMMIGFFYMLQLVWK